MSSLPPAVSSRDNVVVVLNLPDGLQAAPALDICNLDEVPLLSEDKKALVVPVGDEDVANVVRDDSGGHGELARVVTIVSVSGLGPGVQVDDVELVEAKVCDDDLVVVEGKELG